MSSEQFLLPDAVTREYLLHHRVCPVALTAEGALSVATAPDAFPEALDELAALYQRPVVVEQTSAGEVERLVERLVTARERSVELTGGVSADGEDDFTADVRDLANQPPVVRYVNLLVRDAYDAGASDIHLEATRDGLTSRFRLDGVLAPAPEPPRDMHHAIVSRVKLLAELDIAERRRPQDGRIRVRMESRELDLRVSTTPTLFGESVVLRLLDRGGRPVRLAELGMPRHVLDGVGELAAHAHGMLLVTGPTGSGKTTTLYAALQQRETGVEKIVTVEDPVEYHLPGVTQVPVHRQVGVTFAAALRSILRQDPDVVMIGEMRDPETAEIAIQAAMTGHLVFSTLHTNDAVGAVPRLLDLGVPDYLLSATLDGVLAQRLVRRVCDGCAERYVPDPVRVAALVGDEDGDVGGGADGPVDESVPEHAGFVRGRGCASCRGTGYRGRVGIFELIRVDDELRDAVGRRAPRAELRAIARRGGMVPLRRAGWQRAREGVTTVEEVLRVTDSGFTLIELIVVIAIIATLAAVVAPQIFRNVGDAKTDAARVQIETFSLALNAYRLDNDQYPSTDQGLAALRTPPTAGTPPRNWRGPYLERVVPDDPWGRPYIYVAPGRENPKSFDLYTLGRDGKPGGMDEDADVTSWGGPVGGTGP